MTACSLPTLGSSLLVHVPTSLDDRRLLTTDYRSSTARRVRGWMPKCCWPTARGCQRIELYTAFGERGRRRRFARRFASWSGAGRRARRWPIWSGIASSIRSISSHARRADPAAGDGAAGRGVAGSREAPQVGGSGPSPRPSPQGPSPQGRGRDANCRRRHGQRHLGRVCGQVRAAMRG